MKKVALKPVTIPLPRSTSSEVLMSVAKAEQAMRENLRIIEDTLNNINATIIVSGADATLDANNVLHIS